jgi:DNA modification methylase
MAKKYNPNKQGVLSGAVSPKKTETRDAFEEQHHDDPRSQTTQTLEELEQIEKESVAQQLPEQKSVFRADSIKNRARKRGVHNLPDQLNPPMGFDPDKAYDSVFPFIKLPFLQPNTPEDNISFDSPELPPNKIYFGDNLHVLRSLPANCVDLIYIDPPFFSGRNYNQIWGDDNEVRTFYDIWEDGLPSYLVWLNARLWEMKRVLKDTGSIYVHCDWHASHYIKCEMDKIFGYDSFQNEFIWYYGGGGASKERWGRKHDVILFYTKGKEWIFNIDAVRIPHKWTAGQKRADGSKRDYDKGKIPDDVFIHHSVMPWGGEKIGYPTQKPEELLERIIKASSVPGDLVADLFMGGATTLAVALKNGRRFIGCDISRVASSVALNRIIKDAEVISGKTASVNVGVVKEGQASFELTIKKVPDIKVYYLGVYPIEKFATLKQEDFEDFILTSYGARRFTGEGTVTGVMNATTSLLVGPADPRKGVSEDTLKQFVVDSLKLRYQENIRMKLKVVAWVFPPSLQKYAKKLKEYFYKENVAVDIELIPINSQLFRKRILEHYRDADENEFLLKFVTSPSIAEIAVRKISHLKYQFEAVGARSNNLDGFLINCQWDFDFKKGLFAEAEYSLMRKQENGKFVAVLEAEKTFEKAGKYLVACRVQDNLGGEATITKEVDIT